MLSKQFGVQHARAWLNLINGVATRAVAEVTGYAPAVTAPFAHQKPHQMAPAAIKWTEKR